MGNFDGRKLRSDEGSLTAQHGEPESLGISLRRAFSAIFLAGASLTGAGEVQQSHAGGCGCPVCLPPERVRLIDRKKEDESGDPKD
jgi:hypothetical protein